MSTLNDFEVIKALGSGSFSCVYKVKRKSDGQEYAMKKVKLPQLKAKEKENALNEVRILASISDPYIIGYKEAFVDESTQTLCIIMEYAGGGDILNKISAFKKSGGSFKEETVWTYLIQMVKGLRTLHNMKILHRDLKCANVFISTDESSIKLGDLNVSKVAKRGLVYTQTGTPYYASPEVWRDEPYDGKSDIWSLGCIIYEMVTLKPPFRANDMDGLYRKVQKGVFDKIPSKYSTDLANVISSCLSVSPAMRPNCDQLLNHPAIMRRDPDSQKFQSLTNHGNSKKNQELLSTIKMPRDLKSLGERLPKPNYNSRGSKVNQSFDFATIDGGRGSREEQLELKRPSSSHSRRPPSANGSRLSVNAADPVVIKKEPSRRISLDPSYNRSRSIEPPTVVYEKSSRNVIQGSSPNLIPSNSPNIKPKYHISPNYPPLYRKATPEIRDSSPYLRVARSIIDNSQNISRENLQRSPTPVTNTRSRQNNQNANLFIDQERKKSLLSKITSNNILRSLDVNCENDYSRINVASNNNKYRMPENHHVNKSYNNIPAQGRYYVQQPNYKKIDSLIAAQNNKSKISNNYYSIDRTPQKVLKPIWMM